MNGDASKTERRLFVGKDEDGASPYSPAKVNLIFVGTDEHGSDIHLDPETIIEEKGILLASVNIYPLPEGRPFRSAQKRLKRKIDGELECLMETWKFIPEKAIYTKYNRVLKSKTGYQLEADLNPGLAWWHIGSNSIEEKVCKTIKETANRKKQVDDIKHKQEWRSAKERIEQQALSSNPAQSSVSTKLPARAVESGESKQERTESRRVQESLPEPKKVQPTRACYQSPIWSKITPTDTRKLQDLYEAILGEKNRIYYLTKFEQFDQQPSGLKASWNWPAFFCIGVWALYRKMYGWFFAFWGITMLSKILEKAGSPGIGGLIFFVPWIAFTIYANSLYHRAVKKEIAVAQLTVNNEPKLLEYLQYKGGVHTWVIWVFGLLPVAGILATMLISMSAK